MIGGDSSDQTTGAMNEKRRIVATPKRGKSAAEVVGRARSPKGCLPGHAFQPMVFCYRGGAKVLLRLAPAASPNLRL